jgi:hypothetical protein
MAEAVLDPLRVLAGLRAGGVRYVLVGDLAAMAHGSSLTPDRVEICVSTDDDVVARLGTFLQTLEAERDEAGEDPHRVAFRTTAGRVECLEMPSDRGYAELEARASDVNLGHGVTARVASPEDIAAHSLHSDDLVGAVRATYLSPKHAKRSRAGVKEEDEFGPEKAASNGRRMTPWRRVWKAFEDFDGFMTNLMDGSPRRSRDGRG